MKDAEAAAVPRGLPAARGGEALQPVAFPPGSTPLWCVELELRLAAAAGSAAGAFDFEAVLENNLEEEGFVADECGWPAFGALEEEGGGLDGNLVLTELFKARSGPPQGERGVEG